MYIKNGIAYAGEQEPPLKVVGIRPMPDHRLWVRFSTGEAKTADFRPLLDYPCYAPLKDESCFNTAYIDYGVVTWMDGLVDIATEHLYSIGISATDGETA